MPQRPFYALLIGINQYQCETVPDLRGCVHDATTMHNLLQTHFGGAAENMTTLIDAAATHQAIRAAFQLRLLAPLQAWAANGRLGEQPAILFYFSGHGSRAPSISKPSGFDETLVPHDSRTAEVYDIKDWELGEWLAELTPYTDNVTVILDCCHSGSGTRSDKKAVTDIRGCHDDLRPQPARAGKIVVAPVMRGAIDLSKQRGHLGYVLLAACRNDEKAREDNLGEPPQRQGLLTYWLQHTLRAMEPQQPLRYRELYDQVHHRVQSAHRDQTPQCEGDRDRLFLGGVRAGGSRWLSVLEVSDGLVWVDSGQAHGLTPGSIVHVYAAGISLENRPAQPPLAILEVETVEAARSGCRRIGTDQAVGIPPGAQALVHTYGPARTRTKLALMVAEGWFLKALRERLLRADIRPQIELTLPGEQAALQLTLVGEYLQLQDGSGEQIYQRYDLRALNPYRRPFQADDLTPVVRDLQHRLHQRHVQLLASEADSEVALAIAVQLDRLLVDAHDQSLQTAPLASDAAGNVVIPVDQPFVLHITNHYTKPLFFTLLELGYAGDINRLYPQIAGANDAVASQKSLIVGQTADRDQQFRMQLPAGMQTVEETFKIIATTEEANFEHLLQGKMPPQPQPASITRGGQTRDLGPSPTDHKGYTFGNDVLPSDRWGIITIPIKIVRTISG